MREREEKKSLSVMDFDLIFQITPSPSQKADQMSHHGDIIKKNKQTNKQNKKKLINFPRACRMKEGQQKLKRLQLSQKKL